MAKQHLTKEFVKETIKQYNQVKANVKKVFDMIGTFYGELVSMFDDKDSVHYWWDKVSDELKFDNNINWDDLDGNDAFIQDDNEIDFIEVSGRFVWAYVTNYMVDDGRSTRVAVPLEIVINPKILADTIKKYRKQAENEQKRYDSDAENVIGKIAEKFINKYGEKLSKISGLWSKFTELVRSTEEHWSNYRIHISEVYIRECADGLDHLFVVYEDRYCNSRVYVSGFTN